MIQAMLWGLLLTSIAIYIEGGHLSSVISAPSFALVMGSALGGLYATKGARITYAVLRAAVWIRLAPRVTREELYDGIRTLELCAFLGGAIGVAVSLSRAVATWHQPPLIGPAIHLGVTSLLYAFLVNVFFAVPLKQQLLQEAESNDRLDGRQATMRMLRSLALCSLATVLISLSFGTWNPLYIASLPALLFILGAIVPSVKLAADPVFRSPISQQRQIWYSDALIGASVICAACLTLHCVAVLDSPELFRAGLAHTIIAGLLPIPAAVTLRALTPHPRLRGAQPNALLYPTAGAFALLSLAALGFVVYAFLAGVDAQAPVAAAPTATPR